MATNGHSPPPKKSLKEVEKELAEANAKLVEAYTTIEQQTELIEQLQIIAGPDRVRVIELYKHSKVRQSPRMQGNVEHFLREGNSVDAIMRWLDDPNNTT